MSNMEKLVQSGIAEALKKDGFTPTTLANSISRKIVAKFDEVIDVDEIKEQWMEQIRESMDMPRKVDITINGEEKGTSGIQHEQFDDLLNVVALDIPVMLVGSPGTGKTTSCENIAEALGYGFHALSVGMQTTKTDILGFIDAGGKYRATAFRKAFEDGGIFLMDEVDAGNPNVLVTINSAISNGFCEFPDAMVKKHENFRFVATANTFGNGTDAQFVGRNKLDAATLDRFVVINWGIDEKLERLLTDNDKWLEKVHRLRQAVAEKSVDFIVTPRMSIFGARLLAQGFSEKDVKEMVVFRGLSKDVRKFAQENF